MLTRVAKSDQLTQPSPSAQGSSGPWPRRLVGSALAKGFADDLEIGFGKVIAEAEEGFSGQFRIGIGEAVSEIQAGRVPPFAKAPVGIDRESGVLLGKGDDDQPRLFHQADEESAAPDSQPGRKHDPGLCQGGTADTDSGRSRELVDHPLVLGLPQENGRKC